MSRTQVGPGTAVALLALTLALARFLYAWPLELLPDEAYHALLGERPAFGYFDHPPLLMWLLGASTWLFGRHDAAVRLVPVVLGAWTVVFAFRLASRLFTDRVAWCAVVLMCTTPLFIGGLLATPDVPLLLALTAASYYLHRALTDGRTGDWLITGVWAGLALLSKYSATPWFVSAFLCLWLPKYRPWLVRWQPWMALGIAVLLFAPVIAWNAQHEWVSFSFQVGRGIGPGQFPRWVGPAEHLVGQSVVVGPLALVAFLGALFATTRSWSAQPPASWFLSCLAIVPFTAFLFASLFRHSEANWPCFTYVPGLVLVAQALVGRSRAGAAGVWAWRGILVSNVVLVVLMLVLIYVPGTPVSWRADDFFGFREVASRVEAMARARPDLALAADRYQIASKLAFYTGRDVTCFNVRSRPNQYDLWRDDQALRGRNFLLIDTGPIETTRTADRFRSLRLLDRIQVKRGARVAHDLFAYEATGYRGGPSGDSP